VGKRRHSSGNWKTGDRLKKKPEGKNQKLFQETGMTENTNKKSIAVILSGCGHLDGAEIHEATLTLLAVHRAGADFQCYAPNVEQFHVIDHITGEPMEGKRNILVESARIARGNIKDLKDYAPENHDALVLPGGFGAAKNLSTFAFDGAGCTIENSVEQAVTLTHKARKPIGALCIAPVILAKLIKGAKVTLGTDLQVAENIKKMGGIHEASGHGEIIVDLENRLVTTPCYMLDSRVDQVADGAERLIREILTLA
jgi:enhancing lycopene biosynthesis protein 2